MNSVSLIGRLTRDPELRYTQNNVSYCKFTLAVNRVFSRDKEADFINCTAWKKTAENLAQYMRKGSQVGVVGSIQTGSYQAQDGSMRYTTEVNVTQVIFLDNRSQQQEPNYQTAGYSQHKTPNDFTGKKESSTNPFEDISDKYNISNDDLPF